MIRIAAVLLVTAITACQAETAAGTDWTLVRIDGTLFPADATLTIAPDGRVSGRGPCNSYSGGSGAQYPAFDAARVRATKRACPDLRAEALFFQALAGMRRATRKGDMLLLDGAGRRMEFTASE